MMLCSRATSILDFLCERGFGCIEEDTLQSVCVEILKCPLPGEADADGDMKTELALTIMHEMHPEWTDTQAHRALHIGYLLENPEENLEPQVPEEVVVELVQKTEEQKIRAYFKKAQSSKCDRKSVLDSRRKRVARFFKKKEKAPKGPKTTPRWKPSTNPKASSGTAFIQKNLPPTCVAVQDDYNGRWRIIADTGEWKSVSWTKRGLVEAAGLALYWAWTFHALITGQEATFDIDELQKEFQVEHDK